MATQKVNVSINVDDGGTTQKLVKSAEALKRSYDSINTSASKLGGTGGSRTVAAKAAPRGSEAIMTDQSYGTARGSAGLTGASARDFAAQSQGLGGLVRLYATYAANLFAVGAAFRALRDAMDTSNMVRGLDQLGAATGRNLGGLSKRLVELTDGAISFRESMQAVAQTSSAGMSSKNIERLAVVAKNASMALGVSMPDAISRLSRGITKLEPELLDELGIMTKIDPAVQAYARQVGKAAGQLTDFERRQAFANAVLAEGEQKFGELASSAANPYDRLLSSLKNVSQQALEIVNKVLSPVVNLLASSPGALAGAIAVLGTLLVKQALPALTEFKASLASAAESATALSKRKAEDAKAARAKIDQQIMAEVEARASKEIDAVDAAERKIEQLRKAGYSKNSNAAKLLAKDLDDIRKEDLAKQEAITKRLETRAANLAATAGTDPKAVENAKKAAEANREVVTSITAAKQAQDAYIETEQRLIKERETSAKGFSIYGLTIQAAAKAQETATKKGIVSNAAYNASLVGMTNAFRLMSVELQASGLKLTTWETRMLKAKASLAMFAGVMGTIGSVVNKALGILGMVAAVVGIIDSVFSKASKELDTFSSALGKVDDAAENAARTLANLDKKGGFASATIDGVFAMANALNELSSSAEEAVVSAARAQAAMGGWEKTKDWFYSLFGGGIDKNLAKSLTKDISSALDLLTRSGLNEEAQEKFKKILNVNSLDAESVKEAILKLSDASKTDLVKALSEANTQLNNGSARLQAFKSATEGTTKAYQDFILSTANTNPIFKLGQSLEILGKTMVDALSGGAKELEAAMLSLATSPEKGMLFGSEFTQQLVDIRQGFMDQTASVEAYRNRLQALDKDIAKNKALLPENYDFERDPRKLKVGGTTQQSTAIETLKELEKNKAKIQETINLLPKDKIEDAKRIFTLGMQNAFKEGSKLIDVGLGLAAEKAAQTIAKARLGGLSGEARAQEENRIAKQDIQIQLRAIDTSINLILSQERLKASIDESNAIANLAAAKAENRPQEVIDKMQSALTASTAFKNLIGTQGTPNLEGDAAKTAGLTSGRWTDQDAANMVRARALQLRQQLAPQMAARTEQQGAMTAQDIIGKRAERQGQLEDLQKLQGYQQAVTQQEQTRLSILDSITGVLSTQAVLQQSAIERKQLEARQLAEIKAIDTAIANAATEEEVSKQKKYKLLIEEKQAEETRNLELQKRQKLLNVELDSIGKRFELIRSNAELEKTIATTSLDQRSQELSLYANAYDLSQAFVISQQARLDQERALLETTTAMQAAQDILSQRREEAEAKIQALRLADPNMTGATLDAIRKINAELDRQTTLTDNTIAGLSVQYKSKIDLLEKTKEINLEQERYNQLIKAATGFADSLKEVFGGVGEKIGAFAVALTEVSVQSEKNAKAMKLVEDARSKAYATGGPKEIAAADKEYALQKKKSQQDELAGNIKIVSSAKGMFKEKTAAYKALNIVEKTLHIYRMGLWVKEVAMETWAVAKSITASITKISAKTAEAGVDGTAAVIKAIASVPFPINLVAGALTAAAVGSLLNKLGGSGPGFSGGAANTGTGTTFGDKNAVSESLSKSKDVLEKSDPILMRNSMGMLKHLRSIDTNIAQLGVSLIKALPGGGDIASEKFEIQQGMVGQSPDLLGRFIPILNNLAKALGFGTKTSVKGQGILAGPQTLQQIEQQGFQGSYYADVRTERKALGITYSEKNRTEVAALDNAISQQLGLIFKSAGSAILDASSMLGESTDKIAEKLNGFVINIGKINLQGLSAEDQQKRFEGVVGAELDKLTMAIYPQVYEFIKVGEGAAATLTRMVYGIESAQLALEQLGMSAVNYTAIINKQGDVGTEIVRQSIILQETQALIKDVIDSASGSAEDIIDLYKQLDQLRDTILSLGISQNFLTREVIRAAGGTEKFTDSLASFYDKFTTEGTKLALETAKVNYVFEKLNLQVPKTRAELSNLVVRLSETAPESAAVILSIVDSLDTMYTSIEKSTESIDSIITKFRDFARSITTFKDSLVLSAASTATPLEKYLEAKTQFETTFASATAGDKSAMDRLTSTSQTFLDMSKQYYASSDKYSQDFQEVLSKLDFAAISASASADVAQLQLDAQNTSVALLSSINDNIAQLVGLPKRAAGGMSRGLTLVGELGPELVDFTAPGQVYTATQTAGMFTGTGGMGQSINAMVVEIQQLKAEVVQLRKDQQKQTGDLIISNYDANKKAAEEVATAVTTSSEATVWADRSKVVIS